MASVASVQHSFTHTNKRHFIEVEWPVRRFDIAEYERIAELDVCVSGHHELLDGLIVWNPDRTDMGLVRSATLLKTRLPLRRFSVAEYEKLIQTGVLLTDERLELIDGLILEMSPINPRHAECVDRLNRILTVMLHTRARIRIQSPISLGVYATQPQPDITIATLRPQGYADHHPNAQDVLLVIEVSDSTLADDRAEKLQLYAASGILEYWIFNLVDLFLEAYQEPFVSHNGETRYRTKRTYSSTEKISPLAFPDCQIDLSEVFPN
jgi:Uma2 family endonuclease